MAQALAAGIKLLGVMDANTGEWIDRATVRDTLGNETRTTNIGIAALSVLEPLMGYYMLEVRKAGYAPQRFRLKADTAAEFLIALTPNPLGSATALPAVITTERRMITRDAGQREGFFGRCGVSTIQCVGRKDLDRDPTGRLQDFVGNKFGIRLECRGVYCVIEMKTLAYPPEWCTPTYFLNGAESRLGQGELDQMLSAQVIDGIEVYLTGMPSPARFSVPGSPCGAIVIWTH